MINKSQYEVVDIDELEWPSDLCLPAERFRLLIAADVNEETPERLRAFARLALQIGMVYFCAWGSGCERFHDFVDEVIKEDDIGPGEFAVSSASDVVMTTWHANDTLDEALDFLAVCAVPADGFAANSSFRLVISLRNPAWNDSAATFLANAPFFV